MTRKNRQGSSTAIESSKKNTHSGGNGDSSHGKLATSIKDMETALRVMDERLGYVESFLVDLQDSFDGPNDCQQQQSQQQKVNGNKGNINKNKQQGGKSTKGANQKAKKSSRSCAGLLVSLFIQLVALTSLLAALSIVGFVGHRYYVAGRPPTVDEFVKAANDGATFVAVNAKQGYSVAQKYSAKYYKQFERDYLPTIKKYTAQGTAWAQEKGGVAWVKTQEYYVIGSKKAVEYFELSKAKVLTWYAQMQGGASSESAKATPPKKANAPPKKQQAPPTTSGSASSEKPKAQQQQNRGKA